MGFRVGLEDGTVHPGDVRKKCVSTEELQAQPVVYLCSEVSKVLQYASRSYTAKLEIHRFEHATRHKSKVSQQLHESRRNPKFGAPKARRAEVLFGL